MLESQDLKTINMLPYSTPCSGVKEARATISEWLFTKYYSKDL